MVAGALEVRVVYGGRFGKQVHEGRDLPVMLGGAALDRRADFLSIDRIEPLAEDVFQLVKTVQYGARHGLPTFLKPRENRGFLV